MESKIEAMRRLEREWRWKEASEARLKEKRRLQKEEGMTRREANEASWKWLSEAYPPMPEHEVDWTETWMWAAMRLGPITHRCVDAPGEVPFRRMWWVFSWMLAWDDRIVKDDPEGANTVVRRMHTELTCPHDAILATLALQSPRAFFRHAQRKFEAVIERLDADPSADPKLSEELSGFKNMIPGMIERLDTEAALACDGVYLRVLGEEEVEEAGTVFSGAQPEDDEDGPSRAHAEEDTDDAPSKEERCDTETSTV